MRRLLSTALLAAAPLSACVGYVDGAGDSPAVPAGVGPKPGPNGNPEPSPTGCGNDAVIPARAWRLTTGEYRTTVARLLELPELPGLELEVDPIVDGFDNNAGALSVSTRLAADLQRTASSLATRGLQLFAPHSGCASSALGDEACVARFIASLGAKAFRRPLAPEEVMAYLDVYRAGVADEHAARGVMLVVETLLQSPYLLYRSELGDPATLDARGVMRLAPYELASALSYALWGEPPDESLLAAASTGALTESAELGRQALRLFSDARARPRVSEFAARWLGLQRPENLVRAPEVFPDFEAERPALFREFDEQAQAAWLGSGAKLGAFFFDPQLASQQTHRIGLLTSRALIASWSRDQDTAPMTRGKNLLGRVLCQSLPPPPPELQIPSLPPLPSATTRARFEAHGSNPTCRGCHEQLDSVAFALEHFDSVGNYRDTENGMTVDASGTLAGGDFAGAFADVTELGQRLATSRDARACVARQYVRFAAGGNVAQASECVVSAMLDAAQAGADSPAALIAALLVSPYFHQRQAP